MRKIRLTEEQIKEIGKRLTEMDVYQAGNGTQTSSQVVQNCRQNNSSLTDKDSVIIPADTVTDGKTVNDGKEGTVIKAPISECGKFMTTKKQIKENRLKKLKESCSLYTKKNLFK